MIEKQQIIPSHVAVLVPSVEKSAQFLRQFDFQIGAVDEFEETREIYIQHGQGNPLLLMEPKGTGSYQRALEKRGPGLHHLAIDVLDLKTYLKSIKNSGWLLHLNSVDSIKDYKTAYLARPGFPALIEVQEKQSLSENPWFVEKIDLPLNSEHLKLVQVVGLENLIHSKMEKTLTLAGKKIQLQDLF